MVKISVIIPVYQESRLLAKVLDTLLNQRMNSKHYEIIVVIDEPTEYSLDLTKKYCKKVKFILNKKRVGKANALNRAVKHSSGDILLFLDADVTLPNDKDYLKKVIEEIQDADILDIKKEVIKDSFLSTMTYYEYIGFNIGFWFVSKFVGRCPSINGSAFAIKRKTFISLKGFRSVVSEDLDIAMRAFLKNYKFKYTKRVKVYNSVHSNWKNWFTQRKRWAIGAGIWLKEWYKDSLKICTRQPQIFIPSLFLLFPSLTLVLLYFLIPNSLVYKVFSLIFLLLAVKLNFMFPVLWLSTISVDFIKSSLASILSFLLFS
ncbi:MAG: glycosyltransferase family 2 protein, partial [Candidatus Aenigmarchaeota archaeon]|nr:glycosyltransferase family 2 protein [Candidatus Aenigmarchaeota archaeon]